MFYKMYKLVRFYCSLMWYGIPFLQFLNKKLVCHYFISNNETSIMNCSLINHNNPVLWALPFIQATAEVILHNYSKFPVFERGLWKRPIAVQIQNIGDGFFHQPLLLRLDARAGCQINDTNRNGRTWRWMKWNMRRFPPTGNPGCRNTIG